MQPIQRNVLLNPGPATTTDTVKYAQVVPDICPREGEFGDIMRQMQKDLVRIVHGDPDKYTAVLFCGSGTINIDICINSLLPGGKKILVVNNGAYSARAVEICRFYGLPHIDLEFAPDELPDLSRLRQVLRQNPDVGLVHTTHNETGTGILNPIKEIGAVAHEHGCTFCVDTTSTYAMIPMDIEHENVDFCMASAQKGLMAMAGLSFIVGKTALIEQSAAYPTRSYYCNLYLQYRYFKETGEMHFTPPVQTVYAARQAIAEYWTEGEDAKWARHSRLWQSLHDGLARLGFREVIKREWQSRLVIAVAYPADPRWDFRKVHDYCYARGFTIYPGKIAGASTFRLCSLGAIDVADIDAFYVVFEEALRSLGMALPVRY